MKTRIARPKPPPNSQTRNAQPAAAMGMIVASSNMMISFYFPLRMNRCLARSVAREHRGAKMKGVTATGVPGIIGAVGFFDASPPAAPDDGRSCDEQHQHAGWFGDQRSNRTGASAT